MGEHLMVHNITERDGMFVVRAPSWHGLETAVFEDYPTREQAQAIAHPWEPISEPVYRRVPVIRLHTCTPDCEQPCDLMDDITTEYEEVEGFKLNVRSDTSDPLGVVSDTFEPVKNAEMYDIAEAIEGEAKGSVMFETGGSLKGGRKVWLLIRLRDPLVLRGDQITATIPYYALQNSHDGSGSFRGQATMTRIVCHEAGTPILHENRWIKVEEHPSFMGMKSEPGLQVSIEGLPFTETVTLDHRYRTSKSEDREDWTYARDLEKGVTEIAYPIDMTIEKNPESEDFWWAMGLWWANGHLTTSGGIGWSVANTQPEIGERLLRFLRERGFTGKGSQRRGCKQIVAGRMPDIYQMLSEWYRGEGSGKGAREKVPSSFVERLPLNLQQAFVDGYFAGDGYTQKDREARIFLSSSLDCLLVLRRILMRLGQPCSIRLGRKGAHASVIEGREVNAKDQWSLRAAKNPQGVRIEDGILYSKVKLIEWVREMKAVPITTENNRYITAFGMSSNCDNTAQMADLDAQQRGTEFVFRHTRNVKDRIEEAKEALSGWRESVDAYRRLNDHLLTLKLEAQDVRDFVDQFIPMPKAHTSSERVIRNVEQAQTDWYSILLSETCEGVSNTAYGLVQASVEYLNHARKARSNETRFKRAYLDRDRLVSDAVQLALEVAR